jgi:hypothetical protein
MASFRLLRLLRLLRQLQFTERRSARLRRPRPEAGRVRAVRGSPACNEPICPGLQPLHAAPQGRERRLRAVGQDGQAGRRRCLPAAQRRGRDAGVLGAVVGGKVVHGEGPFETLAPPSPKPSPDWSPVGRYARLKSAPLQKQVCCSAPCGVHGHSHLFAAMNQPAVADPRSVWGGLGCGCAF